MEFYEVQFPLQSWIDIWVSPELRGEPQNPC